MPDFIFHQQRLGQTLGAFGPNNRSVWAKHPERLIEIKISSLITDNN